MRSRSFSSDENLFFKYSFRNPILKLLFNEALIKNYVWENSFNHILPYFKPLTRNLSMIIKYMDELTLYDYKLNMANLNDKSKHGLNNLLTFYGRNSYCEWRTASARKSVSNWGCYDRRYNNISHQYLFSSLGKCEIYSIKNVSNHRIYEMLFLKKKD